MLSSISSFIPTNILASQVQTANGERPPQPFPDSPTSMPDRHGVNVPAGKNMPSITDAKKSKAAKREKTPNENFIIVRPPPSKSNHPLNLQVQLLPPNTRSQHDRSSTIDSRRSLDVSSAVQSGSDDPNDLSLRRTSSTYSDTSTSYSTSVSSFASTSTTSSGRRAIIPLYNLQAHNVMTNLVVDAGTDAKIAKFLKRGIEFINLAVLEPIEVWVSTSSAGEPDISRGLLHSTQPSHASRSNTPDPAPTPGSSAASVSSAGLHHIVPDRSEPAPPQPLPGGAKKLFGKLFKKKDVASDSNSESPTPTRAHGRNSSVSSTLSPPVAVSKASKRLSAQFNLPISTNVPTLSVSSDHPVLGSPVLGINPTLDLPNGKGKEGRPTVYVWVVRKWLKGPGTESLFGGLVGKFGHKDGGGSSNGGRSTPGHSIEVKFEWKRGKSGSKKGSKRHAKEKKRDREAEGGSPEPSPPLEAPQRRAKRLSTTSIGRQSISTVPSTDEGHGDAGEESDPEDSETPWNCVLKIQRCSQPASPVATSGTADEKETGLKLRVATLSPTPHHPKVVGLLKIPFPLPDFEVDSLSVLPRNGRGGRVAGTEQGLTLTAEEVKDIVSSTALWLVVREAFGGIGKVGRKGDGWRIRG